MVGAAESFVIIELGAVNEHNYFGKAVLIVILNVSDEIPARDATKKQRVEVLLAQNARIKRCAAFGADGVAVSDESFFCTIVLLVRIIFFSSLSFFF